MDRRAFILGWLAAGSAASADAQPRPARAAFPTLGEGQTFDSAKLLDLARNLARQPHAAPANDLPEPFANLNYEQYLAIRARPNAVVFAQEGRAVAVEPLHRGFVFSTPVQLHIVEDGTIRRIAYDPARFEFGRLQVPDTVEDLGFSGFRIVGDGDGGAMRQFAIVQGATFFRAIARGQNFGVMARALALKIAEQRGEEIPLFRAFWIERPRQGETALTVHALIESESLAGTWKATFRPGDITIVDVETTLVARAAVEHMGFGTMSSTFLFGPNYRRNADDIRPAVYESGGLQMQNGRGEWIWRPLSNRTTLQISAFLDENPRGFGLMQRDRDYATFMDDDQHYEARPSLWIEPVGDWGAGTVQLIEIPTDSEVNDNVIAYWRPKQPLPAGGETTFAYRQFWCWGLPEPPALATVKSTRVGRGSAPRRRRFAVDFQGDIFADPGRLVEMRPMLRLSPGTMFDLRLLPYPERRTCRVSFEIDPGADNIVELRLVLEAAEKPLSETWLYRWTP